MTRIIVSARAKADADQILAYLAREGGWSLADEYQARFAAAYETLSTMPEGFALQPSLGQERRFIVVRPYLMVYRHDPTADRLTILRIIHGKRDRQVLLPKR